MNEGSYSVCAFMRGIQPFVAHLRDWTTLRVGKKKIRPGATGKPPNRVEPVCLDVGVATRPALDIMVYNQEHKLESQKCI